MGTQTTLINKRDQDYTILDYTVNHLPYITEITFVAGLTVVTVAIKTALGWKAYHALTTNDEITPILIQKIAGNGIKIDKYLAIAMFPNLEPEKYNI